MVSSESVLETSLRSLFLRQIQLLRESALAHFEKSLHSLFLRQIRLLHESARAHFKSATTSEEMPSGFAFSTAESLSSREVEESRAKSKPPWLRLVVQQ
jgi:hypothetical protein